MFSIPGTIGLILFLYVRPQEYFEILQRVPFLYLLLALALFGLLIDLRLRIIRARFAPTLGLVIAFIVWAAITVGAKAPERAVGTLSQFLIPMVLYLILAHGVQTFKAYALYAGTMLALALFLAVVCVHQGYAPLGCVMLDPERTGDMSVMAPGRAEL